MKELSIEEKAKAYDEAIKKAGERYNEEYASTLERSTLAYVFPKLKEYEDDRIRKSLIGHLKECRNNTRSEVMLGEYAKWIAWLEKQGERANFRSKIQIGDKVTRNKDGVLVNLSQLERISKPNKSKQVEQTSDKIEPKFKIGDWIIYDGWTTQIKEVYEDGYSNIHRGFIPKNREDSMRLWTIQDAKEGDVLTWDNSRCIALFKNIYDKDSFNSYGCVGHCTGAFEAGLSYHDIEGAHPTTKEQRDLLFQKMKEAGYEWNAEKKELRKIEQKPDAWGEEDEIFMKSIVNDVWSEVLFGNVAEGIGNDKINWLKALKDRVQPQKQEWSEEDEEIIKNIIAALNKLSENILSYEPLYQKEINWLKSLKERYTWKPSDEQMKALEWSLHNWTGKTKEILESLQSDLKKLREK